ncbi:transketolase [Allohahella sp. A8]|uniref:transketolase n=1 Tax=Allohahella sp. A8 TaxID=3141461 RepID=UPI003A7FBB4D
MPSRRDRANAIRALSMDAVQRANSGHPGAPMGMADIAEVLWNDFLQHNPADPAWVNRDRFVLSNGHGSMLLYSLLHLSGYDVSIEDIKNFRQLHSKTPGHPELGYTPGVETTTGPLGQGLANGVGMAIAERTLAAQFNRPGHDIVNHHTYVFMGDGCLMEGISHEVCSLAGTLKLGKLICFYDDNGISIDGEVEGWFTDDTPKRFEAYGWHVVPAVDGHDGEQIASAIKAAQAEGDRPSIIICKTKIGFGSPNKEGKESSHGSPLGADEIAATRKALGWSADPFVIPDDIRNEWDAKNKGQRLSDTWQSAYDSYRSAHPELAEELLRRLQGDLPQDFEAQADAYIQQCQSKGETIASRKASQNALNAYGVLLPELLGGSADLAGSNNTIWAKYHSIEQEADGNYVHYGVREFGMSAIMNGITLHGGFIPYGATFLVFMEYARNAVRMAALMKQRVIFVYSHDSIGLGEDGPTHQGIEQLTNLRTTPNLHTWRPADAVESAVCWKQALVRNTGPSALIFTRQNLPHQNRDDGQLANIAAGAYVLFDSAKPGQGIPDVIIIATGSEVGIAMEAANKLAHGEGAPYVRVVSMPCAEAFLEQDHAYQESVLPGECRKRIAVEAGHVDYWHKFTGLDGRIIGMRTFGESAPAEQLFEHFGITSAAIVEAAEDLLDSQR